MAEPRAKSHPEVIRPPEHACCPGCGEVVGDQWVSYRQDPNDPEAMLQDFSQLVLWDSRQGQRGAALTGTFKGFSRATQDGSVRAFRDPEDLGVFFHPTCAPK